MRWYKKFVFLLLIGLLSAKAGGIGSASGQSDLQAGVTTPVISGRQAVPHEAFQLKNGLRVLLQEDHRTPFITVCVVYQVGAINESPGKSGLAHFFEHLMFEGSKSTLPRKAMHILTEMGAVQKNALTGWDRTIYFETIPAVNLESALWLESDRMVNLTGADNSLIIDDVRNIVKNERRQRNEIQALTAGQAALVRALFPPSSPYSRDVIGSMADLDRATIKDMREFYKTWYGPNNAVLVLVGDLNPAAARRLVEQYFEPLPSRGAPPAAAIEAPALQKEARLRTQDPTTMLPSLFIGWSSPPLFSADDAVADVVAKILERRLYQRLTRTLRLAVESDARQESRTAQSLFRIRVVLRSASEFGKTLTLVDALLEELRQNTATNEELARAQLSAITDCYWRIESQFGRAELLAEYVMYRGTADWFRQDLARYQRITADDVGRFVRAALRPTARVVVEVERAKGDSP